MPDSPLEIKDWPIIWQVLGGFGIAVGAAVAAVLGRGKKDQSTQKQDGSNVFDASPRMFLNGPVAEMLTVLQSIERLERQVSELLATIAQQLTSQIEEQKRTVRSLDEQSAMARDIRERQMRALDLLSEKMRDVASLLRDIQGNQASNFRDISGMLKTQTETMSELCSVIRESVEIARWAQK